MLAAAFAFGPLAASPLASPDLVADGPEVVAWVGFVAEAEVWLEALPLAALTP